MEKRCKSSIDWNRNITHNEIIRAFFFIVEHLYTERNTPEYRQIGSSLRAKSKIKQHFINILCSYSVFCTKSLV